MIDPSYVSETFRDSEGRDMRFKSSASLFVISCTPYNNRNAARLWKGMVYPAIMVLTTEPPTRSESHPQTIAMQNLYCPPLFRAELASCVERSLNTNSPSHSPSPSPSLQSLSHKYTYVLLAFAQIYSYSPTRTRSRITSAASSCFVSKIVQHA